MGWERELGSFHLYLQGIELHQHKPCLGLETFHLPLLNETIVLEEELLVGRGSYGYLIILAWNIAQE